MLTVSQLMNGKRSPRMPLFSFDTGSKTLSEVAAIGTQVVEVQLIPIFSEVHFKLIQLPRKLWASPCFGYR
ncbi:hypothetical protein Y032_0057g2729 [Ancylostoma ceylanicum]|uniref:Uncharacterized protein n=1 Tax=Ancylostoma ceylanicum TaxID=53326 RepID=A0A016U5F0_9BILA|nr:hypothetical protein Y032_0057g2729 [Ancylostoma ceylanicum]